MQLGDEVEVVVLDIDEERRRISLGMKQCQANPWEEFANNHKKGQELETVVLSVDPERERISLGVKQIDQDPFSGFVGTHTKGSVVKGTVKEIDAKGAVIILDDGVEGYLRASELSRDRVEDARTVLKEGQELEAKFVGVDRKNRTISLSIKAKDADEEAAAIQNYASGSQAGTATLGDVLKEQMGGENGE